MELGLSDMLSSSEIPHRRIDKVRWYYIGLSRFVPFHIPKHVQRHQNSIHYLQPFPPPCSQPCRHVVSHHQRFELVDVGVMGEGWDERGWRVNASVHEAQSGEKGRRIERILKRRDIER